MPPHDPIIGGQKPATCTHAQNSTGFDGHLASKIDHRARPRECVADPAIKDTFGLRPSAASPSAERSKF
jgi:hypothetical protein